MNESHPWRDKERLREKYWGDRMTCKEIAEEWGCATRTISTWLNRHGIETRETADYQGGPWRNEETLRELYVEQGLSTYEVADELGCAASVVGDWLDRHDIETDDPGWPELDFPWKDKELLERLYWEEGLTQYEIADKLGTYQNSISFWMQEFGIRRRRQLPHYHTREDGYEAFTNKHNGDIFRFRHHRLIAVAHGVLDVSDFGNRQVAVHHKTNIPWDNRPGNLESMPRHEHSSMHNSGDFNVTER